jgi:hypothetical protein
MTETTESVVNETIEKYWYFFCLVIGTDWMDVLTGYDIKKKIRLCRLCLCYYKNELLMVNFEFACQHCPS